MSQERRGTGTIYQRGNTWWIQYSHRGQLYRESVHSHDKATANRMLNQRLREYAKSRVIGPTVEKVTLEEMRTAILDDYHLEGNRSIATIENFTDNLLAFFGPRARAIDITGDRVAAYVKARLDAGMSNASINRETACLRRMFKLMIDASRLSHDHVPKRPRLKEAEPRKGFLEPAEFAKLRDVLPAYLRDPVSFLYLSGWRKGAMCSLMWSRDAELEYDSEGNITGGSIHLAPENSKNKSPWTLPLTGELIEVIRSAWRNRKDGCPYIFHDSGVPIYDFRRPWRKACKAVGLDALLVHDLRRSCARNLVRAGVPERIAMSFTGHKTRSMFDRYNIVGDADLRFAMNRVSECVRERAAENPKVLPLRKTPAAA
jgi:integrase